MKFFSNTLSGVSLVAAVLLSVGCGGGSSSSATSTVTATTVTVERGQVIGAEVIDKAGQKGRETSKGQYVFDAAVVYPISVSGGVIDINKNGSIDLGEPFLKIPMTTYEGDKITLATTLIADADATVRNNKLLALKTALETSSGKTINQDTLLALPSQSMYASVLSNELYEAVLKNEINTINDLNLTEMTTALAGAQFVTDFGTSLTAIESNATLVNLSTEDLAQALEEQKFSDIGVAGLSQTEVDIINSTYQVTEDLLMNKSFVTYILNHGTTMFGTSMFDVNLFSDHTATGTGMSSATWKVQDGSLHIRFTHANGMASDLVMKFQTAPSANFNASFSFIDADGNIANDSGSFALGIASNRVPTAASQSVTVLQESSANAVILGAEDPDGDTLSYSIVANPTNGTLSTGPALSTYVYTPNTGYSGSDSFSFKVNDGSADSNIATVSITVNAVFVNTPPTASSQAITVDANSLNNSITLNGADSDGNTISYTIVATPSHGTLSGTAPNINYTPANGFTGSDSFTFKTNDGTVDSALATVNITVAPALSYGTVTSPFTGRVWMDRNMGASRVCLSYTDTACFGDYYQWGRDADGHEKYGSTVSSAIASDIHNVGSSFMDGGAIDGDWTSADVDQSLRSANWSKTDGTSVCPAGFRIPTMAELQAELVDVPSVFDGVNSIVSKLDNNFLKLPAAGSREYGLYYYQGEASTIWVSDSMQSYYIDFNLQMPLSYNRGENIRCIKN